MNRLRKIFGIGPMGASISLLLFALAVVVDRRIGRSEILVHAAPMKAIGIVLMVSGIGLHFWSFQTLRHWWTGDKLCMDGPFKYFRHPMYAAWITFVSPGVALYLNSWVYVLWALVLHPIWHLLVKREEALMTDTFGDTYWAYAARTGRFVPRWFHQTR